MWVPFQIGRVFTSGSYGKLEIHIKLVPFRNPRNYKGVPIAFSFQLVHLSDELDGEKWVLFQWDDFIEVGPLENYKWVPFRNSRNFKCVPNAAELQWFYLSDE